MAFTHYVTNRITVAAGATSGADFVAARDDNKRRTVTGLYVNDHTDNVRTQLVQAGGIVAEVTDTAFNSAAGFLPVDAMYDVAQEIHVNVVNTSGGAVTTDITVRYQVDAQ